jgi:hypothetical protein
MIPGQRQWHADRLLVSASCSLARSLARKRNSSHLRLFPLAVTKNRSRSVRRYSSNGARQMQTPSTDKQKIDRFQIQGTNTGCTAYCQQSRMAKTISRLVGYLMERGTSIWFILCSLRLSQRSRQCPSRGPRVVRQQQPTLVGSESFPYMARFRRGGRIRGRHYVGFSIPGRYCEI